MDENNVNGNVVEKENKKKSKLEIALYQYRRQIAAEQKVKELEEKEKQAEAKRKQRRKEKLAKQKAVDKAKKELAAVRAYANVKKEPSNIRKEFAVKGYFDILDMCNAVGTRDFSDAYNFVGNTKWLLETLMENLTVNKDTSKLEIDIAGMRSAVFDKKAEIEKIIDDFKMQLDSELKKQLDFELKQQQMEAENEEKE